MKRRRVLVLLCGGTLVMEEDERGSLVTPSLNRAVENLLGMEHRLGELANIDVAHIDNIDSSNIRPAHWDRVATVIGERYDGYDGFVITHGTDTMAYTASALSFVLGNLGKPVVLTGSQIPGSRLETDARRNFVNAVRVATLDVSGVLIVFDRRIILGARATKVSESRLDAFESVSGELVGEIRLDIRLSSDHRRSHRGGLELAPGFEENVAIVTLAPGMPLHILTALVRGGIGGLVLRGFGTGNVAYEHHDAVALAAERGIPVVVTTQCLHGATAMQRYDLGRRLLDLGAIQGYDMGTECIVTKLMWALKRASSVDEVREIMHRDYCGEIRV
ncbi:MAG: asparaginase, partial [Candidatus Eisenbacteria bacterium]